MANEKRLIYADALSDLLDVEYKRKMKLVRNGEEHLDTLAEGIMSVSILLGTMPTVDAVEVVRCKDCKHWQYVEDGMGDCTNPRFHLSVHPDPTMEHDGFCSAGERSNNE